jgi:hypothetical protein
MNLLDEAVPNVMPTLTSMKNKTSEVKKSASTDKIYYVPTKIWSHSH